MFPENAKFGQDAEALAPRKGCGCWAWGCAGVLLVGVLGFAALAGGTYWVARNLINTYTSDQPQQLAKVEYEGEKLEALQGRVKAFSESIKEGSETEDLVLSADDLNALISADENLRGKVFVRIENGQVAGDVSFPLDQLPMGKGRYFNASASFDVMLERGLLMIILADAEVRGEKLPAEFLRQMRGENLAQELYKNPETAKVLERIDEITIGDGEVILRVRREETSQGPETPEAPEEPETPATDAPAGPEETPEAP